MAKWHYKSWGDFYSNWTIEECVIELENQIGIDEKVPYTWVGIFENKIVGSVSIIENDLLSHSHLNPWIGNLYVKKSYRGRGIGTILLQFAMAKAINWNLDKVYLYTLENKDFYLKRGWLPLETINNGKFDIDILVFNN